MTDLRLHEIEPNEPRTVRAAPRRSPLALCAAGALVAALAATVWAALTSDAEPPPDAGLPALSGPEPTCSAEAAARAQRASEALAAADAKLARYPFAPAEGLAALQLLREAERCFALAGDGPARASAGARSSAWHARLQSDARDAWLRYRVAIASARPRPARGDIELLLELYGREHGPFTARLRRAQLELADHPPGEETP